MGCVWSKVISYVVERVGDVIQRYEDRGSFEGIEDVQLMFIPKSYLMCKVRTVDLELVWFRLPKFYREDVDLIGCRPCLDHYVRSGDVVEGCIRRRDCVICKCILLRG